MNENGTLGGKIKWECLISEDSTQPIYRDDANIYISKAGQYNAYHASYAGVEYKIPIRFSYRFGSDEGATLQLEKLLTDGITDLSDYETIEEFTALFPKAHQEKAREYYEQVMALKKTFDNTRTGTYRGDWDYSITGKSYGSDKLKKWVDNCESAKVDKAKELSVEIWENIFGLKAAREAINKYTDSDKLTGDRVIKMAVLRESYLQELEKSYKNHTLEKLSDVEKLIDDRGCGEVFRVKGFLQKEDGSWIQLNATHNGITMNPIEKGQEVIIVIGEGLKEECINKYFEKKK